MIDLEDKFQKIHKDINKNIPTGMIYHYTSFDGLENILKERNLRYTDYKFFNDPTELEYGKNLILEALIKQKQIPRPLIQMTRLMFEQLDNLYKLYVCCFSAEINKLALWRYYASNGAGCAIGFNSNFYKPENLGHPTGKSCISSVIYGKVKSLKQINRFIDAYIGFKNKDGDVV